MRAYVLAPLAAVATLTAPMLAVAILAADSPAEAVAAAWLLNVPVVAWGLPLAFGGEILLVLVARVSGRDPRVIGPASTFVATGIVGYAIATALWLGFGRELPWGLTLIPLIASLVGAATFLRQRKHMLMPRAISR